MGLVGKPDVTLGLILILNFTIRDKQTYISPKKLFFRLEQQRYIKLQRYLEQQRYLKQQRHLKQQQHLEQQRYLLICARIM